MICLYCKIDKPLEEMTKDRRAPQGRQKNCKECNAKHKALRRAGNPEKYRKAVRQSYHKHAKKYNERKREYHLKRAYGITEADYYAMLAAQNGTCAICETKQGDTKKDYLKVDHCHTTGKIRGLLCNKCNLALGLVSDRAEILMKLVEYLAIASKKSE